MNKIIHNIADRLRMLLPHSHEMTFKGRRFLSADTFKLFIHPNQEIVAVVPRHRSYSRKKYRLVTYKCTKCNREQVYVRPPSSQIGYW